MTTTRPDSKREMRTAELEASLLAVEAELATYERAVAQFDQWLGEQANWYRQNPQVHRTFLDCAAALMKTLRGVRHVAPPSPPVAPEPAQENQPAVVDSLSGLVESPRLSRHDQETGPASEGNPSPVPGHREDGESNRGASPAAAGGSGGPGGLGGASSGEAAGDGVTHLQARDAVGLFAMLSSTDSLPESQRAGRDLLRAYIGQQQATQEQSEREAAEVVELMANEHAAAIRIAAEKEALRVELEQCRTELDGLANWSSGDWTSYTANGAKAMARLKASIDLTGEFSEQCDTLRAENEGLTAIAYAGRKLVNKSLGRDGKPSLRELSDSDLDELRDLLNTDAKRAHAVNLAAQQPAEAAPVAKCICVALPHEPGMAEPAWGCPVHGVFAKNETVAKAEAPIEQKPPASEKCPTMRQLEYLWWHGDSANGFSVSSERDCFRFERARGGGLLMTRPEAAKAEAPSEPAGWVPKVGDRVRYHNGSRSASAGVITATPSALLKNSVSNADVRFDDDGKEREVWLSNLTLIEPAPQPPAAAGGAGWLSPVDALRAEIVAALRSERVFKSPQFALHELADELERRKP